MARVKNNVLVQGMSGKLGGLLLKHYSYGTVVSKIPDRSKVKLSVSQKTANKNFKEAVAYARAVLADTLQHKKYAKEVKKGKSLYHAALADFLKRKK